jgi:type I restriction enzyme S subunit
MATSASTQIREGWQELPLIECTSDRQISYGVVQPGFPVTDGVPIVRVNNLVNGRIITNDAMRIAPEIDYSHRRTKLRGGEILISLVGTTGSVAIVPDELSGWNVARAIAVIRPDEKIGASWLKLCLESSHTREYLDARANTTVQKTLNLKDVKQLPIPLPPPHWRQEILSLVSPIENAITNLEDQNRSLEATAQAIFKSWFVDFDPVRVKAEGREPEGMDAATAALFPSTFEDSELGPIPQGWTTGPITNVLSLNPTRSLKKKVTATYLDMASVPTSGPRATSWIKRDFVSGSKFINGDTLLARITPCLENGKTAYVDFLEQDEVGWGSTEFIVVATKPNVPSQFAYLLARDPAFRQYAIQSMSGTSGRQRVQVDQLAMFKIAIANDSIYRAFGTLVEPLFQRIKCSSEEQTTLTALRDTLLPRLISGKLRVPEAEAMLMEVM